MRDEFTCFLCFPNLNPCFLDLFEKQSTFLLFFFNVISVSSHDACHLVPDLFFLSSILHRATSQSKDSDESVSLEEPLVVDRVVALLKEVVLVRVIVLDADFPVGGLLAKESASMRENFSIDDLGTRNNYLSENFVVN
jgi:hypothetical protein